MKKFLLLAILAGMTAYSCTQKPDMKEKEETLYSAKSFVCQEWSASAGAHSLAGRASYKSGANGWGYYTKGGDDFIGSYFNVTIVSETAAGFFEAGNCPVVVDTEVPLVSITAPVDGALVSGSVTFSAEATDNVGVTQVQFVTLGTGMLLCEVLSDPFTCTWDSTEFSESVQMSVVARALDAAGNEGFSEAVAITVNNGPDTEPPVISLIYPAEGDTLSGTVVMRAQFSDNRLVTHIRFDLDGWPGCYATNVGPENPQQSGVALSCPLETYRMNDGVHTLQVRAMDAAENITASEVITVNFLNIDTEAPVISFTTPREGQVISGNEFVLMAEASDNLGVHIVRFYEEYDNTVYGLCADAFNAPYNCGVLLDVENGPVKFTAKAWDHKGNLGEAIVNVIVDNQLPVVTVLSPAPGATLSGTVSVRIQAEDATKIVHAGAVAGFGTVLCEEVNPEGMTGSIFECQWNTAQFANGAFTFKGAARDQGGNWGYSEEITVTLSNALCKEYTATNAAHVSAGRAKAGGYFNLYAYTIGSNESLGLKNAYTTTTVKETAPGYFAKGKCN